MKRKNPRLTQIEPPPLFEVLPTSEQGWRLAVRDAQSADSVHYRAALGRWTMRDLAIAGARTAANGEAMVSIQRIVRGIPEAFGIFAVRYFWGQWQIALLRGGA